MLNAVIWTTKISIFGLPGTSYCRCAHLSTDTLRRHFLGIGSMRLSRGYESQQNNFQKVIYMHGRSWLTSFLFTIPTSQKRATMRCDYFRPHFFCKYGQTIWRTPSCPGRAQPPNRRESPYQGYCGNGTHSRHFANVPGMVRTFLAEDFIRDF